MSKVIQFTKTRTAAYIISILLILIFWGVTYARGGFNWGIDFKGGLSQEISISGQGESPVTIINVRDALKDVPYSIQVQQLVGNSAGTPRAYRFSLKAAANEEPDYQKTVSDAILKALQNAFTPERVEIFSSEFVGASYSRTLMWETIILTLVAQLLILVYLWFRFQLDFAISAIIATLHDAFILIGFIGAFQLEFSTATVAAILTIIGYSINDTIVIFDRIRENRTLMHDSDYNYIINASVTQTLNRTIITSGTTLMAVGCIFFLTSGSIKIFALELMVGIVVGTFSSIFIASNCLVSLHNSHLKKLSKRDTQKETNILTTVIDKMPKEIKKSHLKIVQSITQTETKKQTADEIAEATKRRVEHKEKKKKKKK